GKFGGAAFVLIYLFFLAALGLPIMVMEFSVGRASRQSVAQSFATLKPAKGGWSVFSYPMLAANYILLMFYTTITGWVIAYTWYSIAGKLSCLSPQQIGETFGALLADPAAVIFWMALALLVNLAICIAGLQNGVEKVTKMMMCALFIIMLALAVRSVTLPGAEKGLEFYLKPNVANLTKNGGLWVSLYAALGQAFFTLSIGIGGMAIFGSYIDKSRSLMGESIFVISLDTFVALTAGLIIFPAAFAYGVDVAAGPGLTFISLPNIFNNMPLGRLWGSLFFVLMSFAAMSTVVAIFENVVANSMDILGWNRKKACLVNFVVLFALSLPCALGFNVWSSFAPLGKGTVVLDLEDFIVSNNLLPLGSLFYIFFCTTRYGWGWDNFIAEANAGEGLKFPRILRLYITFVVPLIIIVVFVYGYIEKFFM
ncbi:MAG: sodium-dependent transporter, partial [Synergistaceae bacterium]|nr:sodium-dependent transporter [Synergistaceae bacterium]